MKEALLRLVVLLWLTLNAFLIYGISLHVPWQFLILSALFVAGIFLKEKYTVAVLLILLPLFGDKPGTRQYILLLFLGSVVTSAILAKYYVFTKHLKLYKSASPILPAMFFYLLVSVLSLTSQNWPLMGKHLQSMGGFSHWEYVVAYLCGTTESGLFYPILTVLQTFHAIVLAVLIAKILAEEPAWVRTFSLSLVVGLVLTLTAGLLDYYSWINLRILRPLDPVVNPGDVQYRLQSFFGHSGWLAEFIVFCTPHAMILMLWNKPFWLRTSAFLILLILTEFVLLLTFQRGGWLAYPPILLVAWWCIYAAKANENATVGLVPTMRKHYLKIAVCLPITLLVSIGLLLLSARRQPPPHSPNAARITTGTPESIPENPIAPYAERFKRLLRVSDRTNYFILGYMLGVRHPFLGGGSESFAYRYREEFLDPQGAYFRHGRSIYVTFGSAHNVYMQTFSGKGFGGLVLLLLPLGWAAAGSVRVMARKEASFSQQGIVLISSAFLLAFLIYGNVQEVFYIQPLQYLFFANLAFSAAAVLPFLKSHRWLNSALTYFVLFLLAAHLFYEFVIPGHTFKDWRRLRDFGCYTREKDSAGNPYRWCGGFWSLEFTPARQDGEWEIPLVVSRPQTQRAEAKQDQSLVVYSGGTRIQEIPFQTELPFYWKLKGIHSGKETEKIRLDFRSPPVFVSDLDLPGKSRDFRVLGLRVYEHPQEFFTRFRFGEPVSDCFPVEQWSGKYVRWCGRNNSIAVIPASKESTASMSIRIHASHPGISKAQPVEIQLTLEAFEPNRNRQVLSSTHITLRDTRWQDIEMFPQSKPPALANPALKWRLRLKVSRTWNPKLVGHSDDTRDLGVAVETNPKGEIEF